MSHHYRQSDIESIEVMHEFMTGEQFLGFLLGNVYKYLHRHPYKGDAFGDIDKAIDYLKAYRLCLRDENVRNPFAVERENKNDSEESEPEVPQDWCDCPDCTENVYDPFGTLRKRPIKTSNDQ